MCVGGGGRLVILLGGEYVLRAECVWGRGGEGRWERAKWEGGFKPSAHEMSHCF